MAGIIILFFTIILLSPLSALAHCPLCTAGAAAAAVGASWLGVSNAPIGIFIGAFAVAIGAWMHNLLKKDYLPYQEYVFIVASFALTIWPLLMLFPEATSLYFASWGEYGFTWVINLFLAGSLLGAVVMLISPWISKTIGRKMPYQGLVITFSLLLALALLVELLL